MNVYTTSVKESRVILGSFAYVWELRKLSEFVDFFSGLTYKPNDVQDMGTLVLRSSNVSNGEIVDADNVYVDSSVVNSDNVIEGDIIVVVRNGSRSLIGKHAQIKRFMPNTVIGAFMTGIRSQCPSFTNALLSTPHFDEEVAMNMGATINQITGYMFSKMEFTVPSIEEQKKIGMYFDNLDNLITLHQRNPVFLFNLCLFREKIALFNQSDAAAPTWELRKAKDLFTSTADKGHPELPVLSATQDRGMIKRDDNGINIFHDKKNEEGYKRVVPGQFVIHLRSFQGGFAHSAIEGITSPAYTVFGFQEPKNHDDNYWKYIFSSKEFIRRLETVTYGIRDGRSISYDEFLTMVFSYPQKEEQARIAAFLDKTTDLITLHQRNPFCLIMEVFNMLNEIRQTDLFCEYYAKWIAVYKKGAIRKVTMDKYIMTHQWLVKLVPHLKIADLNRLTYQQILNDYAMHHERQTTMDFHHQLKGAVLDAVDEGLIERDPTRKAIIKGKTPNIKKIKYINQFELHTLLSSLELKSVVSWDWFILLAAKTGMRFSEALAITPKDFDFAHQTLSISKTWDYKGNGGFLPTKNKSSVRKIQIDWQTVIQFSELVKGFPEKEPIFVTQKVYNSTVNDILARYCKRAKIPVISVHGLRHTHASLLLFAGVSIASVARRLGHASMTTTQKTYLHIIQELENKDVDLVMRSLSGLS